MKKIIFSLAVLFSLTTSAYASEEVVKIVNSVTGQVAFSKVYNPYMTEYKNNPVIIGEVKGIGPVRFSAVTYHAVPLDNSVLDVEKELANFIR